MKEPEYLGDAVYIQPDPDGGFILTTASHLVDDAGNVIYLEPEVVKALVNYLTKS